MTKMQIWSPMSNLWDLQDEINRLFLGFGRRRGDEETSELAIWSPTVDIKEDKEGVTISAELAGMKKEDVKISVDEGVLTIKGERKFTDEKKKENYHRIERSYGSFSRSFSLSPSVDDSKVKAAMKDGLLEIYLPKKEETKPKEIEIEVK